MLSRYRRVIVNMHKGDDEPILGQTGFTAALALVPDGMPLLKACASHAKWQTRWGEKHRYYLGIVAAPSGRPYAPHLKDHEELSFSKYYDEKGKPVPGAVPMAARPDINRWSYPAH